MTSSATPPAPPSVGEPTKIGPVNQLWQFWQKRWPLVLIAGGVLWLLLSISMAPLTEWVNAFHVSHKAAGQVGATTFTDDFMRGWNARGRGEPAPGMKDVALWWKLVGTVLLPFCLLLTGIGYYIYWHFARKTLFDNQSNNWLIFFVSAFFIWFIWFALASTTLYISPTTSKAGFDAALPTFTMCFWVGQLLIMHLWVRQGEDNALAQATREAELSALTAQVNPPFIFNALRQLQASAQSENLPRTEQSLAQLAGIMQYVLEESRKQQTDISREIEFIRDYLRLQKLRLPHRDTIQISTDVRWDGKAAFVVPLLLNPLIENAFKYGISMQQPCAVSIQLHVADGVLTFRSENSILPRTELEKGTGLGLANVRKRLYLAYPKKHRLTIGEADNIYTVVLNIQL
ncbi:sensor histidine kinase [Fibrella aquatilis]|uniref:Histidine kinase n=1 Tax=Fibrella aquatilis TaxID=2817059 RepID=A0A939G3P8_9BACT|nr:histidine kinase [Fibrella aquatilis]MBO0931306.1 histidine kinase [Fibrella aquatilis]